LQSGNTTSLGTTVQERASRKSLNVHSKSIIGHGYSRQSLATGISGIFWFTNAC